MLVRDASEFDLIETLSQALPSPPSGVARGLRIGIGDDAAAWTSPEGETVLTTDTMVEGVHFDLEWTAWADLGWKALAVNLSDVAAMGCAPTYAVVTLGLRGDLPLDGLAAPCTAGSPTPPVGSAAPWWEATSRPRPRSSFPWQCSAPGRAAAGS